MPSRSALYLGCLVAAIALITVYTLHTDSWYSPLLKAKMSYNSATGWRERATTGEQFKPTAESLEFAVRHATPVDPDGFTVALFKPNRAVDAQGRALTLEQADFDALVSVASAVAALPQTFQWRVYSDRTSRPIDYITLKDGDAQRSVGVYNWNEQTRTLEQSTEGFTDLPDPIQNILKLASEAAQDGRPERGSDPGLVREVKDILGSAV